MRYTTLISVILGLTTQLTIGRPAPISNYDELENESDLILILSVNQVSERTGVQTEFHGQSVDKVCTKFDVLAVLKGKYDSKNFDLNHFTYPKDRMKENKVRIIKDGWSFQWFSKMDHTYLAFLKKTDEGTHIPVTGQEDLAIAFIKLARVMPVFTEPE